MKYQFLKRSKNFVQKVTKFIFIDIVVIVFIYCANYFFQLKIMKNEFPTFFGLTHVKVVGISMLPTIKNNNYLLVCKSSKYLIGDIVCFVDNRGDFIVHRIVKVYESSIITKGDNNEFCDPEVSLNSILGKVLFVK